MPAARIRRSASGGEPSSAPGDVGRKVIDVPSEHRDAFTVIKTQSRQRRGGDYAGMKP